MTSFAQMPKAIVVIDEKVEIVRKAVMQVSTGERGPPGQIEIRCLRVDQMQDVVLYAVKLFKIKNWIHAYSSSGWWRGIHSTKKSMPRRHPRDLTYGFQSFQPSISRRKPSC